MGTIFLHQLHDNLRSLRFQVSLLVLLLFFVANGAIYVMKTTALAEEIERITALNEARYERVETVTDAATHTYKIRGTEVGSEFIAEAGSNWFQYAMYVRAATAALPGYASSRTTNRWMRTFEVVDWVTIVRYVLSFLCIVLAYNAISGERESGTLRLVLANNLSRGTFIIGKFAAHLATLMIATALGSAISLLILILGGVAEMDGQLGWSWACFLLGAAFFAALFLLLGLGISALAQNSAAALVLLVTTWTVLIVVIPQTSYLVAVSDNESERVLDDKLDAFRDEMREALQREGIEPRPPALARTDGYALEQRYLQRLKEREKGQDRLYKALRANRVEQFKTAQRVNMFSPGFAFQYTVEALLGNGINRFESFERQGWAYRETVRDFVRGRDAADPNSPHILFLSGFMSDEKLDSRQIPRFQEKPLPLAESLEAGMVPIAILLLETLAAFFFALWAFNRAEIAG